MYRHIFKRLLDIVFAITGLLLFFPLLFFLIVGLYFTNKGRVFYFQERPGKNERLFHIIKFKSMNDKTDQQGNLLPDAQRLTPIGLIIRRTSLDEIPQLLNVLKGDMSIVGPRPLRTYYLPLYNQNQKKRHNVKPGITGWAQVNGRNAISWEEKFLYDVWYVERFNFMLDLKIIILTIKKVFVREGIAQKGQATVEAFNGNN